MKYTMYWYDLDKKTHSRGFESENDETARKYALKYHKDNIDLFAVGLSVYKGDTLLADWTKNNGRWHSNIRKKKKEWHPFGL